jgi:hypothetical protein
LLLLLLMFYPFHHRPNVFHMEERDTQFNNLLHVNNNNNNKKKSCTEFSVSGLSSLRLIRPHLLSARSQHYGTRNNFARSVSTQDATRETLQWYWEGYEERSSHFGLHPDPTIYTTDLHNDMGSGAYFGRNWLHICRGENVFENKFVLKNESHVLHFFRSST